jgi:dynein heavy chain
MKAISNCHPDFRLLLTSYPSSSFPVAILQSAVKLTTESPDGLRQNMLDSYLKDPVSDEKFFVSCKRAAALKSMTFGLAFFHALVQERKAFGPLGWNIPYGWNDSDFRISARQLHMFLDQTAGDDVAGIPYKALSYIIGEVNYGGRVTDDWDRRTLIALLSQFITPAALQPGYALSASGTYVVPPEGPPQSYLDYIRTFPPTGAPEIFGLHENADITKEQSQTNNLFASILQTEAGASSGKEATRNRVLDELSSDVLRKIPQRFDIATVQAKYPVQYSESMNTVLVQECIRYNRLTDVIRSSLSSLRKALVGEVVMSKEIELLAQAMFDGVIPDMWAGVSYPSLKPLGSYVSDLVTRLRFLLDWIENDVPSIVPLPCLYFTQSFLTGVLQNYARRNKVAIDDVAFDFEFLDPAKLGDKPSRPESGAYVKGLYLEGARWDFAAGRLAESLPKVLFTPAPVVWLKPCRNDEIKSSKTFDCPVYRTTARRGVLSTTGHSTNFVMSMRLPTNEPANRTCTHNASFAFDSPIRQTLQRRMVAL